MPKRNIDKEKREMRINVHIEIQCVGGGRIEDCIMCSHKDVLFMYPETDVEKVIMMTALHAYRNRRGAR